MLLFCPYCSNALTVSRGAAEGDEFPSGQNRLECRACTYDYRIKQRWFERKEMKRKEVDDVLGGKDAWKNVDKSEAQCTREGCDGTQAYFKQIQIRSADEPMTIFYRCTTCEHQWRQN